MQEFQDELGFVFRVYNDRNEVSPPSPSTKVEVGRYPRMNFFELVERHGMIQNYSSKLKVCANAVELIDELTSPTPPKETTSKKSNHIVSDPASERNILTDTIGESKLSAAPTYHITSEQPLETAILDFDLADDDVVAIEGKLYNQRTGEELGRCRHPDNMYRAWKKQREKALASIYDYRYACFETVTLDNKPSFDEMNDATVDYIAYIKEKYNDIFSSIFIFLEPHATGHWHAHLIPSFTDIVPEDFEAVSREWWDKLNDKSCDEQLRISHFINKEDIKETLDYLKPTSKKKRGRIKFYPLSRKAIRSYGDTIKPTKALADFETAQQVVGAEMTSIRSAITKTDPFDDTLVFSVSSFFFEAKENTTEEQKTYCIEAPDTDTRKSEINNPSLVPPPWRKIVEPAKAPPKASIEPDEFVDRFIDTYTIDRALKDHNLETSQVQIYGMYKRECEDCGKPIRPKNEFDELLKARGITSVMLDRGRLGYTVDVPRSTRRHFKNRSWL